LSANADDRQRFCGVAGERSYRKRIGRAGAQPIEVIGLHDGKRPAGLIVDQQGGRGVGGQVPSMIGGRVGAHFQSQHGDRAVARRFHGEEVVATTAVSAHDIE
jgi:hypothetical protein